jgi:hypothetical protein
MIDPITDYGGKIEQYADADVRSKLLKPLLRIARRHNFAVVYILHLNKKTDLAPRQRVLGSVAYTNVPRSLVMFSASLEHPNRTLMMQNKPNLLHITDLKTVAFSSPRRRIPRVEWDSEWLDVDIQEVMAAKQQTKQERAKSLLRK